MQRNVGMISVTLVLTLLSSETPAGTITAWMVPNASGGGALANMKTNDVTIDAGASEQINTIQIYAELSNGSFYNHGIGDDTPPSPEFVSIVPALQFDTFVASGVPTNAQIPAILGASVDLGSPNSGGAAIFDNNTVDVRFSPQAGQSTMAALNFLAARLTMEGHSYGTFKMDVEFSGGGPHASASNLIIAGCVGSWFPEPSSLGLLSIALLSAVGVFRRHR